MATAELTHEVDEKPEFDSLGRRLLKYDSVTSFILAMNLLFGIVVVYLFGEWLSNQVWPVKPPPQPVSIVEIALDAEEGMRGDSPELGENALADSGEPTDNPLWGESMDAEPQMADLMTNILTATDSLSADPSNLLTMAAVQYGDPEGSPDGQIGGGARGRSGGEGNRGTGEGSGARPPSQRWTITYDSALTAQQYGRILDSFGIELGVVRGGSVQYISNFSKGTPKIRTGGDGENRLYFAWQNAQRRKADADLIESKTKIKTAGAILVQFFPKELEEKMLGLERAYRNQDVKKIRNTKFGIRPSGAEFEFYVMGQTTTSEGN